MISIEGEFGLKLRNVHPRALIEMLPEFLDVFKSGKIVHMTTAVQHGNNRILQLMKRGYKIEDLKFAINAVKNACQKLKIRTQLMVGFPGETDSEFNDTLKFRRKCLALVGIFSWCVSLLEHSSHHVPINSNRCD